MCPAAGVGDSGPRRVMPVHGMSPAACERRGGV